MRILKSWDARSILGLMQSVGIHVGFLIFTQGQVRHSIRNIRQEHFCGAGGVFSVVRIAAAIGLIVFGARGSHAS